MCPVGPSLGHLGAVGWHLMCPVGPSLGHLGAVGWQPTGLNVSCWTEFGASWGCRLATYRS